MAATDVHYRYKLNENAKKASMTIEGISLKQEEYSELYSRKQEILEKYIRTKVNFNGIIDYEEYIPMYRKVVINSKEEFDKVQKAYSSPELMAMGRAEIVQIAKVYGISSVNRQNEYLIKLILDAQKIAFQQTEAVPTLSEITMTKERGQRTFKKVDQKSVIARW